MAPATLQNRFNQDKSRQKLHIVRLRKTIDHFLATTLASGVTILLFSLPVQAQRVSAGVVAGVSLTGGYADRTTVTALPPIPSEPGNQWQLWESRSWSRSRDLLGGEMLELHLTDSWSVEVNGLFRQINGQYYSFRLLPGAQPPSQGTPKQIVTWQFPVMAKYRFQWHRLRPFVAFGAAFRTAGNLDDEVPSHHGLATGAGLEFRWGQVKISPALRFTVWAGDETGRYQSDQLELLVSFSQAEAQAWRPLGQRVSVGFAVGANMAGELPYSREVSDLPADPQSPYAELREPATTVFEFFGGRGAFLWPGD